MIPFATSLFVESIGFGLITASVLAIAAVGFTMQFAVTNLLNLAFVGVMIVSAYVGYLLNEQGISVWIAVFGSIIGGALLSWALNSFIYRPFQRRGAPAVTLVVVSVGMFLILRIRDSGGCRRDERLLRDEPGRNASPGLDRAYRRAVGADRAQRRGHAARARADAPHAPRQGDARDGREPRPRTQLWDPHRSRRDHHLVDQRGSLRPRGRSSGSTLDRSQRPVETYSSCCCWRPSSWVAPGSHTGRCSAR